MTQLRDALRRKFKTPQDAIRALGLDEALLNEGSPPMSNRELATTINAVANRTVSFVALQTYLKPRLAMDAKISLAKAFDGVTGKTFKSKKPAIAASIREQAKGKIAKDASLDDVEKVLDMLDGHEVDGGDESVSEPQHKAMEAAAHGASEIGIPEKVGKEFEKADKGKTFDADPIFARMREKGMSEDDISALSGALPKPAVDEDPEEKKKREEEEAKKTEAKDAEMKDMVTKPAMDAAISTAVAEATKNVRTTERALRAAEKDVFPYVGELTMAFDSAEQVYRHALGILGVKDAKTIHVSALPTILGLQRKAGAHPADARPLALDSDPTRKESFNKRFPNAARIGVA